MGMVEAEKLIEIYRHLEDAGLMVVAGKKYTAELMVSHDVVPVVRCKDCENRVYVDAGDEIGEIGGCKLFKMAMPYDSFCSYGKRRSTENV